jgi:PAS domain S-box-containing protein
MLACIEEQDAAINRSQNKFEALINSLEGIVWDCTPDTFQFTFVSRQCERILGYPPEQWTASPGFWQNHLHPEDAAKAIQTCQDAPISGKPYSHEYRMLAADGRVVWIRESGSVLVEHGRAVAMRGIYLDVTAQKTAADELDRLNRRLLETSRLAGMAEVATGVLHNVGNVLNSVSVSATLVGDRLKQSKLTNLCRATTMLRGQNGHLGEFLTSDPKGKLLPEYLGTVSDQLAGEQTEILSEVALLSQNIEHIKEIVAMQQSYAKVSGAFEHLNPAELLDDALQMNSAAFDRHRVELVREYDAALPRVNVDRHKVLQILINLIRNAKYALDAGTATAKRFVARVELGADGMVAIRLRDNGVGIAPENIVNIFGHGFTTKKDGHGFGLHSGANAAKEMGGRLTARSDGPGLGAEFTLELPVAKPTKANIS